MHDGKLIAAVPKGCLKTRPAKGRDTILALSMFSGYVSDLGGI